MKQPKLICRNRIRDPRFPVSAFPGAVELPNGEVVMLFVGGSGFESSDAELVQARSRDGGESWGFEGKILDPIRAGYTMPFTFSAKPTLLPDGEVIAAGYGFLRDRPEMGLSDYAEKFQRFPTVENALLRSRDGGRSWSLPEKIRHDRDGLELSGPALACRDGKLRFFASPFLLNAPRQEGLAFESGDGGGSWEAVGTFFASPEIAPWEVRGAELASGRLLLVFWAYDLKHQKHLNNHIVWSDDGGRTWSRPVDTGLRGQASNLLIAEDRVAVLQARREGDATGLYLTELEDWSEAGVTPGETIRLWDAAGKSNSGSRIEEEFASLKFGQPSILPLRDGTFLLIFWQCTGSEYHIECRKFRFV